MKQIKDAIEVNKLALKKTIKSLKYLPFLVLVIVFGMLINGISDLLIVLLNQRINMQFVYGILKYLIEVFTLSLTMVALKDIMDGSRLSLNSLKSSWSMYINPLMATMFIFWLIEIAFEMLFNGVFIRELSFSIIRAILIVYSVGFQILQSPMLETIYIGNEGGLEALASIWAFLKENILQWVLVMAVFAGIQFYFLRELKYLNILQFGIGSLIQLLVYCILLALVYIYKGQLFSILYNSSFRKRQFMGVFDDRDY